MSSRRVQILMLQSLLCGIIVGLICLLFLPWLWSIVIGVFCVPGCYKAVLSTKVDDAILGLKTGKER